MSNYSKLNIQDLFGKFDHNYSSSGRIDLESLFRKHTPSDEYRFDSTILLETVKKRKQKFKKFCSELFQICCETMISANDSGLTDIIFEVPDVVPECVDYKPAECLKFINEKLKEQKLSSLLLSKTKIFISWSNLEKKISEEDEKNKEKDKETSKFLEKL